MITEAQKARAKGFLTEIGYFSSEELDEKSDTDQDQSSFSRDEGKRQARGMRLCGEDPTDMIAECKRILGLG